MGGTTDEMMIPRTSPASIFSTAKRLRKRTPYSSTVWFLMVATRQWAIMRGSAFGGFTKPTEAISYTPSTVLVLPTSTTSSIGPPSQWANAAGNHDAQPLIRAYAKKSPVIKTVGGAAVTAFFINMHELAMSVRTAGLNLLEDRAKLDCRNLDGIAHCPQQTAILAVERF